MNENLLLGPIVGGLSSESAFLWGRASETISAGAALHAWLGRQPDLTDVQLAGRSWPLGLESGYAGVAPVSGLQADTRYHYALTLDSSPPKPGGGPLDGGAYPSFKTFPLPGQPSSFNFAFGSCFRPQGEDSGRTFQAMEARRKLDDLRFALLIGDQIYADDFKTNSLGKIAETIEEYRSVYAYVWGQPAFRKLLYNLPAFMTLDDHEVDDDWRWLDENRRVAYIPWWDRLARVLNRRPLSEANLPFKRVKNALQAYWEHQGMHAPRLQRALEFDNAGQYELSPDDPGSLAYSFEYGAAAFFVLDTRTMRVRPRWGGRRTMLGEGQWRALERWLLKVKDTHPIKFLVSSCSLLYSMWADIPRDRWSGFPDERDRLLSFLANQGVEGVYVLAGDLHSGHAVYTELYGPQGRDLPLWEFCASPFEQKPSRMARLTRINICNGLFKRQECRFVFDTLNFGLIRVNFDEPSGPQVIFELYGEQGRVLGTVNSHL